jgi:hypothetical protein
MSTRHLLRLAGVTAAILLAGCKAFEVDNIQVALINMPTDEGQEGYVTSPTAVFIEGNGIGLSSTQVGQEGCVVANIGNSGSNSNFSYIEAGPSITASFDPPSGTLERTTVNGHAFYAMPAGISIPFVPGDVVTITIPGAPGGFPARQVTARTAEAFTAGPITLPTSTDADLPLTWTNVPDVTGSAMFYSIRYSTSGAIQDREIACVFRDDGTGVIGASLLSEFRASSNRTAIAQRGRISANRAGAIITHITSTFDVPVTLTDTP